MIITPKLREIKAKDIAEAVAQLCQRANFELDEDVLAALKQAQQSEQSPQGKEILHQLVENARVAEAKSLPLCQDCGSAVIFLEVGQDTHVVGGELNAAVEEGVSQGYTQGYLRKSMVSQPFSERKNTKDNTPPIIHTEIVPGDHIKIICLPKGAGSENMSRLVMLRPGEGREGIIDFVVRAVDEGGANPCPPIIVGLGIGATSEGAMLLAKKALLRPIGRPNQDPEIAELEKELLSRINDLGIGPMGVGGTTTALAVHVEARPTHIASLPVAINFQCHCSRHKEARL
ncbi:MAG TPA: fumarate hydratase [Dehalococcoidia bacterium]|nr:fumarate hydratase [Dehalococcoidia bacterium]